MKITEKKYQVQFDWQWDDRPNDEYFDSIEEAVEYFRTEMPSSASAVVVQKVAILTDDTVRTREVKVEVV